MQYNCLGSYGFSGLDNWAIFILFRFLSPLGKLRDTIQMLLCVNIILPQFLFNLCSENNTSRNPQNSRKPQRWCWESFYTFSCCYRWENSDTDPIDREKYWICEDLHSGFPANKRYRSQKAMEHVHMIKGFHFIAFTEFGASDINLVGQD